MSQDEQTLLGNQPKDPLELHNMTSTYADLVRIEVMGPMAKLIFGETVRNGIGRPVQVIVMPLQVFQKLASHSNQIIAMIRSQGAANAEAPIISQ